MSKERDYTQLFAEALALQKTFPLYELKALSVYLQNASQQATNQDEQEEATILQERSHILFIASITDPLNARNN